MRDLEFYRHMISKRAAVKALVNINKALSDIDHCYLWGYVNGSSGEYDKAIYAMADNIRKLKAEVEEYRKLKSALKPIIENR
jgi:hypothetical protein